MLLTKFSITLIIASVSIRKMEEYLTFMPHPKPSLKVSYCVMLLVVPNFILVNMHWSYAIVQETCGALLQEMHYVIYLLDVDINQTYTCQLSISYLH